MPQFKKGSWPVICFYLICGLVLFLLVDYRKVAEHAWPKTLSRLRVDYACLVNAANGAAPDRGQLIDGKRYFNAIVSIYGDRPDAWAFLGMSHYYLGEHKAAREYFLKLMARETGFFWARYNLALLAYLDRDYPGAAEYCQQAIQLSPEKSVVFMMASKVYQPLFVENGITPQVLAQNVERAKLTLLQMLIALRSGNPGSFSGKLPVRVF